MTEIVSATVVDGPLNTDQRDELAAAHQQAKPIHRVAKVATFNGWVSGVIAAFSAPFAFFSFSGERTFLQSAVQTASQGRDTTASTRFPSVTDIKQLVKAVIASASNNP